MCARRAIASMSTGRSRCSISQLSTGSSVGASGAFGSGASTYCAWPPDRCGGTTIRRASRVATSEPCTVRTRCRHRSMPAAVPALVSSLPSST